MNKRPKAYRRKMDKLAKDKFAEQYMENLQRITLKDLKILQIRIGMMLFAQL